MGLPLGSNGVRSLEVLALPCCLALLVIMRERQAAQHTAKSALQPAKRASSSLPPVPSHQRGARNARIVPIGGLPYPWTFRGASRSWSLCVVSDAPTAMTLTCSMQACIQITSLCIIYVKSSHNTLLGPEEDCKSYASLNFYKVLPVPG